MNFKLEYIKIPLKLLSLTSLIWFSINAFAVITDLPSEVRSKEFSLSRKALALNGYDPVAYFLDGSTKGSPLITYEWKGVVYHFATEANRAQFIQEPLKYEPQYGGWCAWAMADGGGRTEANPESFKIINEKLYVFYDGFFGDTLAQWNDVNDDEGLINKADGYWSDQVSK